MKPSPVPKAKSFIPLVILLSVLFLITILYQKFFLSKQPTNEIVQPNAKSCLADDCLLVENLNYPAGALPVEIVNALKAALDDEYKALSTYEAVIKKFGNLRPFSMIKGAEQQHIASLKSLFDKYGIEPDQNTWPSKVSLPKSFSEACQIGVDAEIENAKLYGEKLLPLVSEYQDITQVFTNLMTASKDKHLPAFERCK